MNLTKRRVRALARQARVGQMALDGPAPFVRADIQPSCGPQGFGPNSGCGTKMIALTQNILAGGQAVFRFTTPGAFCPSRIYIMSAGIQLMFVLSIRSGLQEQVLGGSETTGNIPLVPAELFAIDNNCCCITCMPCICQPAVPFEVTLGNTDVIPVDATVILIGSYLDATDPRYQTANGCPPRFLSDILGPGCSPGEFDKITGLAASMTPGGSITLRIETPGKFCPRRMFWGSSAATDFIVITELKVGTKHSIISGSLPLNLFTLDNECCVFPCFDCICMPGVPMTIKLRNLDAEAPRTVFGALCGSYEDACD